MCYDTFIRLGWASPAGDPLVRLGGVEPQIRRHALERHTHSRAPAALENLASAGCRVVYINGSFVTSKGFPNDYDACWEEAGVDPTVLDPVLLTFDPGRATQKAKYMGELFPASSIADSDGFSFREFFQTDKNTGRPKGIVAIDLGGLI